MPYLVIATYTRPDPSVSWPDEVSLDPELKLQMEEDVHALAWGKKSRSPAVYPDPLNVIYESVWDTRELHESYRVLPRVIQYFDLVNSYCQSVGITISIVKEEI